MKTAVRLFEGLNGNYYKYIITILQKDNYGSFDHLGRITFQSNQGEEQNPEKWYSMHFECETSRWEDLAAMAKLAKFIKENCITKQPAEVLKMIGAEEYFYHLSGRYMPISAKGLHFFKIMKGSEYYSSIVAPNEILAEKQFQVWQKKNPFPNTNLVFDHIIS